MSEKQKQNESKRRPGGVLVPDDFEKGLYVTVKEYGDGRGLIMPGVALKVLSVQLPFVAVTPLPVGQYPTIPLDTRNTDLIACDEEYRRAFSNPPTSDRAERKKGEDKKVETPSNDEPDWARKS